jgi:protein AroM
MKKTIGMLTIGQSPRDDIMPEFSEILGDEYEVLEAGALDGLTLEEVRSVVIQPDDYILVSRMRNGIEVKFPKRFILPRLQEKISELEQFSHLIVIMCTGKFPKFKSNGLVVTPQEILKGVVEGTLKEGRLGVVYPAAEQISEDDDSLNVKGLEVYADHMSPYDQEIEVYPLAMRLKEKNLDLIFLNCFGFNSHVKRVISEETGVPVIQSNALIARVLKELIF